MQTNVWCCSRCPVTVKSCQTSAVDAEILEVVERQILELLDLCDLFSDSSMPCWVLMRYVLECVGLGLLAGTKVGAMAIECVTTSRAVTSRHLRAQYC